MKSLNENLSEIFNLEPLDSEISKSSLEYTDVSSCKELEVLEEISKEFSSEIIKNETENSINSDSEFARKNIRELILKGHDAIDSILYIAKQSEHPRAFEVAANFIKNISDLNKDLLEIQKRKKELVIPLGDTRKSNDINVNQAVFVGSTKELLKLINQSKKEISEEEEING